MTDVELIAKKLAFIESCLEDLRRLADPRKITEDVREERFVEHTLQIPIQAAPWDVTRRRRGAIPSRAARPLSRCCRDGPDESTIDLVSRTGMVGDAWEFEQFSPMGAIPFTVNLTRAAHS